MHTRPDHHYRFRSETGCCFIMTNLHRGAVGPRGRVVWATRSHGPAVPRCKAAGSLTRNDLARAEPSAPDAAGTRTDPHGSTRVFLGLRSFTAHHSPEGCGAPSIPRSVAIARGLTHSRPAPQPPTSKVTRRCSKSPPVRVREPDLFIRLIIRSRLHHRNWFSFGLPRKQPHRQQRIPALLPERG